MSLTKVSHEIQEKIPDRLAEFPWQRTLAAGSLIAGACFFLAGRRKTALGIVTAGAAVGLLEKPEVARELWESLPGYLRKGQDVLVKVENFVNEVTKQGSKLRNSIG
jgi:hypothetical protein